MTEGGAPVIRRVAVVSDYSMTTLGGAETAYFEQVRTLGTRFEVTAMSPECPKLSLLGSYPGVTAVGVPVWFRLPNLGLPVARNTAALRRFFEREFRTRRIDVVHLHSEFAVAAAALAAARSLSIPVVETVHTFFWQTRWPIQHLLALGTPNYHRFVTGLKPSKAVLDASPGNSALRNMTLTLAREVDRVISPSSHQARRLVAAGLERVDVIPNTMPFPPAAEPLTEAGPPLRLVWIGRFVAEKRILPFVLACVAALKRLPQGALEVDILGDGEQHKAAVTLAEAFPQIRFQGRVPHDRVQQLISAAHISVLTSIGWDNQPMTVVEAITALRGVIYCDPELTEGLQGPGIAAFGDERVLADVIVRLTQRPGEVIGASHAAVEARAEFGVDTFLSRTAGCYAAAAQRVASHRG